MVYRLNREARTHFYTQSDVRFGPNAGQISPKQNKSGTFSVHFELVSQNTLKPHLKKYQICHLGSIRPNLGPTPTSVVTITSRKTLNTEMFKLDL